MLQRFIGTALTVLFFAFVYVEFLSGRDQLREAVNRQAPMLGDIREWLAGGFGNSESSTANPMERFQIVTTHDEFQGDVTTALAQFINNEGTIAQAKLTCAPPSPFKFGDSSANLDFAGTVVTGAKLGCPAGFKCTATMQLAFFNASKPAPLISMALGDGQPDINVVFQTKDLSSGDVEKYLSSLMQAGSTYYNNAIKIEIPTSGKPLTKWIYRFDIQGRSTPMDVALDYTQPELASFLKRCDEATPAAQRAEAHHGEEQPAVFKPPPVYPSAAIAAQIEGQVDLSITIEPDGSVSDVRVVKTSWSPQRDLKWSPGEAFDRAAVETVRHWRYKPTGHRIINAAVAITFRLTDAAPGETPKSSLEMHGAF